MVISVRGSGPSWTCKPGQQTELQAFLAHTPSVSSEAGVQQAFNKYISSASCLGYRSPKIPVLRELTFQWGQTITVIKKYVILEHGYVLRKKVQEKRG